ncbi:MAG: zinc ribbon domain-containing protein [Fimbriimonadaceae bacterium]|nr:zinc ribbon domain-containing protein [Fimbriimonadaceae bacterium]
MIGETLEMVITLAFLFPIFMVCLVRVLWWTVAGDIDAAPGILTMILLIVAFAFAAGTKNPVAQGATIIATLSLMVMFPFASNYLDRHDLREINAEHIDRAFLELSLHPDNFPAWFKLCDSLFQAGYHGHAIALGEQTINRLPVERDPFKNVSLRDMYLSEERMIKQWRVDSRDPKRHKPVACPKCGAMNQPGTINCVKCGIPYLLLLSRKMGTRSRAFTKLVIGWALISGIIPLAAFWGTIAGGPGLFMGIFVGLIILGGVFYWIFRDPSGQPERFTPFS